MADFPTSETGGYTPFQLKYGTDDAKYFRLPTQSPDARANTLLLELDANLKIIRDRSKIFQQEIRSKRAERDGPHLMYAVGDLLLWDPLEHPKDHLPSKLTPRYSGPFRVLEQRNNDIKCIHVVTHDIKVFHVSRVRPFFGSESAAYEVAKLDKDQYQIISIRGFIGNPNVRKSLHFFVEFESSTIPLPYTNDLASALPIQDYINTHPVLIPLRYTAVDFKKEKTRRNRQPISTHISNSTGYIHLRYWDGERVEWYDTLNVPDNLKEYYLCLQFQAFHNAKQTKIDAHVPLLNQNLVLTPSDIWIYCLTSIDKDNSMNVVVTEESDLFVKLLPFVHP
jgi:hypothetical protein